MDEPKKETVRIVLPSRTAVTPIRRLPPKITPLPAGDETGSAIEAPRIGPRRPPVTLPGSKSPLLQPLPKPAGTEPNPKSGPTLPPVPPVCEENAALLNRDPKKETARISILPRLNPVAAPVVITSKPGAPVDAVARSLAWTVFAIALVIFLIQIWNYVVS